MLRTRKVTDSLRATIKGKIDIIRALGFAELYATVSFSVSTGWKWLIKRYKKRKNRPPGGQPV